MEHPRRGLSDPLRGRYPTLAPSSIGSGTWLAPLPIANTLATCIYTCADSPLEVQGNPILRSDRNFPPLRLGLRPRHLSPTSWWRGQAPSLQPAVLAPRVGSGYLASPKGTTDKGTHDPRVVLMLPLGGRVTSGA